MAKLRLLCIATILIATAGAERLTFEEPGQLHGTTEGQAHSAMAVFHSHDVALNFTIREVAQGETFEVLRLENSDVGVLLSEPLPEPRPYTFAAAEYTLRPEGDWASIVVDGGRVEYGVLEGDSEVEILQDGACLNDVFRDQNWQFDGAVRSASRLGCASGDVTTNKANGVSVQMHISGQARVEFHGWILECSGSPDCPDWLASRQAVAETDLQILRYEQVRVRDLDLNLAGRATAFAAGHLAELGHEGWLRLPMANIADPCEPKLCFDGVLQANGTVLLSNFNSDAATGSIEASWEAEINWARHDEESIHLAGWMAAGGAIAGFGVLAGLAWRFWPVILRNQVRPDDALQHPARGAIFDFIRQTPGPTMREVMSQSPVGERTTRHHLAVLVRTNHIVSHRHRATVRYFENHGKHDPHWSSMVLLREPNLARLYDMLVQQGALQQKQLIATANRLGWKPSTTRYRLQKLVDQRLVTRSLQGAEVWFSALHPEKAHQKYLVRSEAQGRD